MNSRYPAALLGLCALLMPLCALSATGTPTVTPPAGPKIGNYVDNFSLLSDGYSIIYRSQTYGRYAYDVNSARALRGVAGTRDFSISAHGLTRYLDMSGTSDVLIPFGSATEWRHFIGTSSGSTGSYMDLARPARIAESVNLAPYLSGGGTLVSPASAMVTLPPIPMRRLDTRSDGALNAVLNEDNAIGYSFTFQRNDCASSMTLPGGPLVTPCTPRSWVQTVAATPTYRLNAPDRSSLEVQRQWLNSVKGDDSLNDPGNWTVTYEASCGATAASGQSGGNIACPPPVEPPATRDCTGDGKRQGERYWIDVATNEAPLACAAGLVSDPQNPYRTRTTMQMEYLCYSGSGLPTGQTRAKAAPLKLGVCISFQNGSCGIAARAPLTTQPVTNLCASGAADLVMQNGTNNSWVWACQGTNGGTDAACTTAICERSWLTWDQPATCSAMGLGGTGEVAGQSYYNSCTGRIEQSRWTGVSNCCVPKLQSNRSKNVNGFSLPGCNVVTDAVCGASHNTVTTNAPTVDLCSAGTTSKIKKSGMNFNWSCKGLYGGRPATCTAGVKSNGVCGKSNNQNLTATPTKNLCTTGAPTSVSLSGTTFSWSCGGINTGDPTACSARLKQNAVCGTANKTAQSTAPTGNLCTTGTPGTMLTQPGKGYSWACTGVNGGKAAKCSATQNNNGVCGSDHGQTLSNTPTNLCTVGNASSVIAAGNSYAWTCRGSNNVTAACSASRLPPVMNGQCGGSNGGSFATAPTGNLCASGTAGSIDLSGSTFTWSCSGANGGTTATCSAAQSQVAAVNGACGSSAGGSFTAPPSNLCATGTASNVGATANSYSWTCAGSDGGSTASCAAIRQRVATCGSAHGQTHSNTPLMGLCDTGAPSATIWTPASYTWSCNDSTSSTTVSCAAPYSAPAHSLTIYKNTATDIADFNTWLGRPIDYYMINLNQTNWSALLSSVSWAAQLLKNDKRNVIAVPMLVSSDYAGSFWADGVQYHNVTYPKGTLAEGATGAYDDRFLLIAQTLIKYGKNDAIIRLGWEMNGSWQPWRAAANPTAFISFYRRIVTVMRSVPGARFEFDWNPNIHTNEINPELAYPGDAYVDYIGLDVYDQTWSSWDRDDVTRWARYYNTLPHGIQWWLNFANVHGKKKSLPEWGGGGGYTQPGVGDNVLFITKMAEVIRDNNISYSGYWDTNAAYQGELSHNQYPLMGAEFIRQFGVPR